MKVEFLNHIQNNRLIHGNEKVLLAISGGIDSMVMAHLFYNCEIPFSIAHCNFQLRGDESDKEEQKVRETALNMSVEFHVRKFNTKNIARESHHSIQLAARELRYNWFAELAETYQYQAIATAHHKDDAIESFFINLLRGTGIRGLTGIPVKQGQIIRPLLCFGRKEIHEYATANNIQFCEDSSNAELFYLRNRVRHILLPAIKEIQPHFETVMSRNLDRLMQENIILQEILTEEKSKILQQQNKETRINIESLMSSVNPEYLLFSILESYGFSSRQIEDIQGSLSKQAGKKFTNKNINLIKDRADLILTNNEADSDNNQSFTVEDRGRSFIYKRHGLPFVMRFYRNEITKRFTISDESDNAQLDDDKLKFPLLLRKWMPGDSIYPLGMRGKKKVSDLLTDLKLSRAIKEQTWVLCSGGDIVWIPGIRMNEKYKITGKTKRYCKISLLNT